MCFFQFCSTICAKDLNDASNHAACLEFLCLTIKKASHNILKWILSYGQGVVFSSENATMCVLQKVHLIMAIQSNISMCPATKPKHLWWPPALP